jgi:hypothetical protein
MACINPNDPEFKKILKEVGGNPLLAAIEFNELYPEETVPEVKPGVQELFDSNPELANQVYEALGFNKLITSNDRIVFGHPTIGKSYLKKQGEDKFISLDDDYATEINNKVKEIADKYNVTTYQVKDGGTQKWNNEYNQMMQEMFNVAKQRAISENKTLFTSNTNLLRNNAESFDKVINLTDVEFEKRIQERGAKYNIKEWKSQINEAISKIPTSKVINTNKYLSDLFITPQQKQQALQAYSQYLDSIFPDSKVKDIVYHVNKTGTVSPQDGRAFYSTSLGSWLIELEEMKGNRNPVLINITNPTEISSEYEFTDKAQKFRESGLGDEYVTPDEVRKKGTDSVIGRDSGQGFNEKTYVTYNSNQVYQLGSKQDIEGFKNFVENRSFNQVELDPELSNYLAEQISQAFNVPIPTMEKDTLITADEIDAFNRDVENRDGRLPSEYFTGIDDVNKWVLNKSELYDLVDKDTGEIYLKDVNLSTGQVEKQDVPSQPVPDKERQEAIDYLNNAVKDFRIDEILAERGYDVNDIISNLASAENKEEFDKIINKLLRLLC